MATHENHADRITFVPIESVAKELRVSVDTLRACPTEVNFESVRAEGILEDVLAGLPISVIPALRFDRSSAMRWGEEVRDNRFVFAAARPIGTGTDSILYPAFDRHHGVELAAKVAQYRGRHDAHAPTRMIREGLLTYAVHSLPAMKGRIMGISSVAVSATTESGMRQASAVLYLERLSGNGWAPISDLESGKYEWLSSRQRTAHGIHLLETADLLASIGIAHKDWTAGNTFISLSGPVTKVGDFGAAGAVDDESWGHNTRFSPPETHVRYRDEPDIRSDIFNLTSLLFYMHSGGVFPYDEQASYENREYFIAKSGSFLTYFDFRRLRSIVGTPWYDGNINLDAAEAFFERGLACVKDDRFQTMAEQSTEFVNAFSV